MFNPNWDTLNLSRFEQNLSDAVLDYVKETVQKASLYTELLEAINRYVRENTKNENGYWWIEYEKGWYYVSTIRGHQKFYHYDEAIKYLLDSLIENRIAHATTTQDIPSGERIAGNS